ncbi:MAG TPA: hypothetical protein VIV36_09590 [Gaiella sp.]
MTPSNEHLVHEHVAERLAAAEARQEHRIADERPERHRPGRRRRTAPTIALSLHPTRKETPA